MLLAFMVDAAVGWPNLVFRAIGHPVTWIGQLISLCDRRLNVTTYAEHMRRALGIFTLLVVAGSAALIAFVVQRSVVSLFDPVAATFILGLMAWPLVATRSLYDHVLAVALPLQHNNLEGSRNSLAMIVGRDVTKLDDHGIARAAIETLAENTSDGVVAPLFWGAVLGLPGIAAYKAINTLDSMIGYRTDRHAAFGWASARTDDLVNLLPARLTGLLIACVSSQPKTALLTMWRDAKQHRSPNAGYPEAAMAGALGVRLSGPRMYADHMTEQPWLNGAAHDPDATDLHRALQAYIRAMVVLGLVLLGLATVLL
ncbi:MAG: adenosylcobinamide-phosphate synthase CbiB [Pseudomonadota bacterium]